MKKYTIQAGEHYSTSYPGLLLRGLIGWHFGKTTYQKAQFTESCLHPNDDPYNSNDDLKDTHKLYGISEGLDHQVNSARFGWKEYSDSIGIYAYVYRNGVLNRKYIMNVPVGETFLYKIQRLKYSWRLSVHDLSGEILGVGVVNAPYCNSSIFRKLYPYYGGDFPAKVDTTIYLDW